MGRVGWGWSFVRLLAGGLGQSRSSFGTCRLVLVTCRWSLVTRHMSLVARIHAALALPTSEHEHDEHGH